MNVFSNLTSPESIYIFLWLLGAFIIGLIVGWFTWGTVKRRLEAELNALNAEHLALNEKYDALKLDLSGAKAAHDELKADYDWKAQRLHDIESEKGDLHTKIYGLKDKLKIEGNAKVNLQNQIDGLNASYNGAKSESEVLALKVKGLEAELEAVAKQIEAEKLAYSSTADVQATIESDLTTANETIETLNTRITALESDITEYKGIVANADGSDLKKAMVKIAILEGNITGLEEQLGFAKADLENCQGGNTALAAASAPETVAKSNSEADEAARSLENAKAAIAAALAGSVGFASADDKDDLTQLKGIGEFIETKLNDLGIYTFTQIANFDDAMIANVTHAIEFFPGRIERDEWVSQARELAGSSMLSAILEDLDEEEDIIELEGAPAIKKVDVEAAKEIVKNKIDSMAPSPTAGDKDNLKVISGVGPFIEEKLNNLGIFTYEQMSLFDDELEENVTDAIEFFPGRIKRDEWVKQARELFKQKKSDAASEILKAMIGGKIAFATIEEKDNLKVISGVGPFIEEKLNSLGIYTYQQISQFDEEIIDLVTDSIMFFPGRIERDGWVAQAGDLVAK
jgi:predicted flap endonuclease-1-like 5' DNA nuclease